MRSTKTWTMSGLVASVLGVFLLIFGFSGQAYATQTSFVVGCPTGQTATQGVFGGLTIISCDGNGDAITGNIGSQDTGFNVGLTCPDPQGIVGPSALTGTPAKIGFACSDNTTAPQASITAASSTDTSKCVQISIAIGGQTCVGGAGQNPIYAYLRLLIQFISGIFGLVAVLMVIIAGFQYLTSGGNPDALKKAKGRLANVVISILLFALMFGILNYLIPGGVI